MSVRSVLEISTSDRRDPLLVRFGLRHRWTFRRTLNPVTEDSAAIEILDSKRRTLYAVNIWQFSLITWNSLLSLTILPSHELNFYHHQNRQQMMADGSIWQTDKTCLYWTQTVSIKVRNDFSAETNWNKVMYYRHFQILIFNLLL